MRRGDDHLRQNYIAWHEPVSQFLARHVNRARAEWANSTAPDDDRSMQVDAETAARVAVLWAKLRKRVTINGTF